MALVALVMNKQQTDFKAWDKGYIVMLTCDEWIQLEKDEDRYISSAEAFEREGRAVRVADKAIMRMMENG